VAGPRKTLCRPVSKPPWTWRMSNWAEFSSLVRSCSAAFQAAWMRPDRGWVSEADQLAEPRRVDSSMARRAQTRAGLATPRSRSACVASSRSYVTAGRHAAASSHVVNIVVG
jgi:hypothetical protein